MSNIAISEIQSVASSLNENDLLLVSKSNGDNTFTSVKCSFDTLVKAILPCSDCQYISAVAEKVDDPTKDYVDFVHTLTKSSYISTDIKNLVGNQYDHRITTFLTLSNTNNFKNTIDSAIVLEQMKMNFSILLEYLEKERF